jgi:hypothetical protein
MWAATHISSTYYKIDVATKSIEIELTSYCLVIVKPGETRGNSSCPSLYFYDRRKIWKNKKALLGW